jgi:HK97 family phage major capsid protein
MAHARLNRCALRTRANPRTPQGAERESTLRKGLLDRDTLLMTAHALINAPNFSHEMNAKANALMALAEKLPDSRSEESYTGAEASALDAYLRTGKMETRVLGVGTPTQTTATNVLVKQGFWNVLTSALKHFDALFDDNFVTPLETDTGTPTNLPQSDDTAGAATPITESVEDPAETDPVLTAVMNTPVTYRTGVVLASREFAEDSGFDISAMLAAAFAVRLGRGIGPALVSALEAGAKIGATAVGSSESTGGSENGSNSVGWTDLSNLIHSIDPAYRRSSKVGFLMTDNSLLALDSIIDKAGRPLFRPEYDAEGYRLLRGYRVGICPSMDGIGTSPAAATYPIAFGSIGHFVTRCVKNATRVQVLNERYAELGQIGYRAWLRAAGTLTGVTSTQSPVKLLECPAS